MFCRSRSYHEYPRQASNVDVARVMLVLQTPAQAVRALALFKENYEVARVKNRFRPEAPLYGTHACSTCTGNPCHAFNAHFFETPNFL